MAKSILVPKVTFEIHLTVTEQEARALDALVGYGNDAFLEHFYKYMGTHYMKPNEDGLRSLFDSVRAIVLPQLKKIDRARESLKNES